MVYITVDFYNDFKCIADVCPNTCCAGWNIIIDQDTYKKMIANQDRLPIPAGDWLVKQDDNVRVILDHKRCPMLNEKNLCHVVLRLGEEYLSGTCSTYPRIVMQYGGITESYLKLSCPEVITKLMGQDCLQFHFLEDETPFSEYPYNRLYLFESAVRSSIVELIQRMPAISLATRLFASYKILERAISLYQNNQIDFSALEADIAFYSLDGTMSAFDSQFQELNHFINEANRYTFLQRLQDIVYYPVYERFNRLIAQTKTYFSRNDPESYFTDLTAFRKSMKLYDTFHTNFWIYRIFSDFISIPHYEQTIEKLLYIATEFCLIQMFALASFVNEQELDRDEYIYIISCISRMMEHDKDFFQKVIALLKTSDSINEATLLLMVFV